MAYVTHFKDLEVYQLGRKLAKEIFELSKSFPKEETYSLTDQMKEVIKVHRWPNSGSVRQAKVRMTLCKQTYGCRR